MQTEANSEEEDHSPVKNTLIEQKRVETPKYSDVQVKSNNIQDKVTNKIKKAENNINGLVDLGQSKEEFQTDVRKQGETDSQSDFDDLEFADVTSED